MYVPSKHVLFGAAATAAVASLFALRRRQRRRLRKKPTVLFFGPAQEFMELVGAKLQTPWDIQLASDQPLELAQQAAAARAFVGGLPPANDLLRQASSELRLLQCHFAGIDWLDKSAVPHGVSVCNATGMEGPIAEWCIGVMLRHIYKLNEEDAKMRSMCAAAAQSGRDAGFAPPFFAKPAPPYRSEMSSCTVGIVGYGTIGACIAHRAAAFGCKVIATVGRPVPPKKPTELTWLGGGGELHTLLKQSDFIILACPLTEKTRGLIGPTELSLLRPTAYLINIARGPVVDEAALYTVLTKKAISGAAIDVWFNWPNIANGQQECAPYNFTQHPFHTLPNVLMSPHTSGWSDKQVDRRIAQMAENLDRVASDRPLINVVYAVGA